MLAWADAFIHVGATFSRMQIPRLDDLLELVNEFCTMEQIKDLLRTGQDNKDVRLSAANKEELIYKNLRTALEVRAVSLDRLIEMVREAEENGHQRIYYHKVAPRIAETMTIEAVGPRLWGKNWKSKHQFPLFLSRSTDFTYADFRLLAPNKKPLDWVLKVYGEYVYEKATGFVEKKPETGRILREFEVKSKRLVLLARWNSPDLLEIRVPEDSSTKRVASWAEMMWTMLGAAINRTLVAPWDLSAIRKRMIARGPKYKNLYRPRDARMRSKHSNVSLETINPDGSLFDSEDDSQLVSQALSGQSECTYASIFWLAQKDGLPSEQIHTNIGQTSPNELIFTGQCGPREIDYVTDKLRFFGR
ncbi:MAG TPA: hypothetical protein VHU83_12830 [Bryobacteraceae bacterium]|nr:hypothetical protein [Bryobacteraceae bacterium]